MSISFFNTHISEEAITLMNQVVRSNMISAGKMADKFEEELIKKLRLVNPVTVNSGTSALHLALVIAGVGPGDEVILPAQTFIATGFVIMMQGAKPVFADIDYSTGNISIESFRSCITEKTKAVIPVHWAGYPCDMDELNAIAKEKNIAVVEDAAHAIGAKYKGKPIGSISAFTAFSFQAIKHLTTGDGGALCCLNNNHAVEAKKRRWFDIDRELDQPDILGERVYNATDVGYKYHLNDIAAALGIGNLTKIDDIIQRHQQIAEKYKSAFNNIPGLQLPAYKEDRQSAYWLFTFLAENREALILALKSRGVPSSVVHRGIDKNSVFGNKKVLPNQRRFDSNQLSVPIHSGMTDENVETVISAIKKGW
jgi:perosamine synthetase